MERKVVGQGHKVNRLCGVAGAVLSTLMAPGIGVAETASEAALREELRQRDRLIEGLVRRVDRLEARLGYSDDAPARSPAPAQTPARAAQRRPATDTGATAGQRRDGGGAAGALDVDELAAERALERTLTSVGVLLLPAKQVEVEPFFRYTRRETDFQQLFLAQDAVVAFVPGRAPGTAEAALLPGAVSGGVRRGEVRRNEYDFGVAVRVGLPFDSQLELELPYRVVEQKNVLPTGFSGTTSPSNTGNSVGDVKVGLAKTLLREKGWLPDLVGRVTWDSNTGSQDDDGVLLGHGFNELRVGLSAVKRQDPLAFTAAVTYQTAWERDDVEPGDEFAFALGTSLAVSPETALSVALAQSTSEESRINGDPIRGSGNLSSLLVFGASSIVAKNTLLSVSVGVGLTDAAPDYTINASLPIRF